MPFLDPPVTWPLTAQGALIMGANEITFGGDTRLRRVGATILDLDDGASGAASLRLGPGFVTFGATFGAPTLGLGRGTGDATGVHVYVGAGGNRDQIVATRFVGVRTNSGGGTFSFGRNGSLNGWDIINNGVAGLGQAQGASAHLVVGAFSGLAAPLAQTIRAEGSRGGTDTNVAGASFTVGSGLGTGNAASARLILATPTPGVSGTASQVLAERLGLTNLVADFAQPIQRAGTQVVDTRVTGYSAFSGSGLDRATVYDTATITLPQLAERVRAIQVDLTAHGLIGA